MTDSSDSIEEKEKRWNGGRDGRESRVDGVEGVSEVKEEEESDGVDAWKHRRWRCRSARCFCSAFAPVHCLSGTLGTAYTACI